VGHDVETEMGRAMLCEEMLCEEILCEEMLCEEICARRCRSIQKLTSVLNTDCCLEY
jgi:hypothetical protein